MNNVYYTIYQITFEQIHFLLNYSLNEFQNILF